MRRASLLLMLLVTVITAHADPDERSQLSALLSDANNAGFPTVIEPRKFDFPRDHGPHPEYRNEWWYITGNLEADSGRHFGFELTVFRFALTPEPPASDSAWRTNQVFIAHFAITDTDADEFYVAERFSRGAAGLAGAETGPFRVWIDDWEIAADETERERWRLRAADKDFALDLNLAAVKQPVLNGIDGLSQKSAEVGNASYYYSVTRWQSDGRVRIGEQEFGVSGLSWLDREWSSSALAADQQGWDWFALQLSDGSDIMFYNLRKTDGTQDTFSGGTWVPESGESRHIDRDEISVTVTATWDSPQGGTYPAGWDIRLDGEGLALSVTPVIDDQELLTTVRYWEGAVEVRGTRAGADVSGRGYVELTGYAE